MTKRRKATTGIFVAIALGFAASGVAAASGSQRRESTESQTSDAEIASAVAEALYRETRGWVEIASIRDGSVALVGRTRSTERSLDLLRSIESIPGVERVALFLESPSVEFEENDGWSGGPSAYEEGYEHSADTPVYEAVRFTTEDVPTDAAGMPDANDEAHDVVDVYEELAERLFGPAPGP